MNTPTQIPPVTKFRWALLVLPSFDLRLPEPVEIEVHGADREDCFCMAYLKGFPTLRGFGRGHANAVGVLLEMLEADMLILHEITNRPEAQRDYRGWEEDHVLKISRLWKYMVPSGSETTL